MCKRMISWHYSKEYLSHWDSCRCLSDRHQVLESGKHGRELRTLLGGAVGRLVTCPHIAVGLKNDNLSKIFCSYWLCYPFSSFWCSNIYCHHFLVLFFGYDRLTAWRIAYCKLSKVLIYMHTIWYDVYIAIIYVCMRAITVCQVLYIQYLIYLQHLCEAGGIIFILQMRKWRLQELYWSVLGHTWWPWGWNPGLSVSPAHVLPHPCATLPVSQVQIAW